jgi:hypothetical protein
MAEQTHAGDGLEAVVKLLIQIFQGVIGILRFRFQHGRWLSNPHNSWLWR